MFQLYVWPAKWDLPTIDAQCLAVVLYLQLAVPGRFQIVECANPDLSPSGQLPFLQHERCSFSPLSSIVAYVSALDEHRAPKPCDGIDSDTLLFTPSLDADLSPQQKASSVAWSSYIETHFGDLILNAFYAHPTNYFNLTLPTLTSFLHFPQTYYVPGRLREMYRPRLEAAGLWDASAATDEAEDSPSIRGWKTSFADAVNRSKALDEGPEKVRKAFAKEKILQKARATFNYLSAIVPQGFFIHGTIPTFLDVILAAHVLLVLHTPLPNPLLKTLILESYPVLIDHALLLRTKAFPSQPLSPTSPLSSAPSFQTTSQNTAPSITTTERPHPPVQVLSHLSFQESVQLSAQGLTRLTRCLMASVTPVRMGGARADDWETLGEDPRDDDGEKQLEAQLSRGRRIWFVAAGVGLVAYTLLSGVVQFQFERNSDGEEEEEDDE
ncbi:hypothetical protein FRB95_009353 [Tulasnella sp. JGI-2019a]|nr:hypothetical protein FRB95_009353 [Tulasnella sp. JGI-2019a]